MSGRSAHVRKEKTNVKDNAPILGMHHTRSEDNVSLADFPMPAGISPLYPHEGSTIRTHASNGSDDHVPAGYARVRKPPTPIIDVSGIEKSSFRAMMDKKSEGARKYLSNGPKWLGKKKKDNSSDKDVRPETSNGIRESHEYDDGDYVMSAGVLPAAAVLTSPTTGTPRSHHDFGRPPPPTSKLPPIPQMQQFVGGKPSRPWAKLKRDPDLWEPSGDLLVHFFANSSPSLRLSTHMIEAHPSRRVMDWLMAGAKRQVALDPLELSDFSSNGGYGQHSAQSGRMRSQTQSRSTKSGSELPYNDGEISYVLDLSEQSTLEKNEKLRVLIASRNLFALIYDVPLVGMSLYQALTDLEEFIERNVDNKNAPRIMAEYIHKQKLDDVRNNPSSATSMLAWHERSRNLNGWKDAFCHCSGMWPRVEHTSEIRHISQFSQSALERKYDQVVLKVVECQNKLSDFDFDEIWTPLGPSKPGPSRQAYERCRRFFKKYFEDYYESWPPAVLENSEVWLNRRLVQKLQKDFGALYDHLVNREVVWDGTEERAGRKWQLKLMNDKGFDADTEELPLTDLLVSFDNANKFPHIPHPYPLTPESTKGTASNDKKSEKKNKAIDDKMAERKAALAYSAATNIYLLGSNLQPNDLVKAFTAFERSDMVGEADLYTLRRGRWLVIYCILQTLATISVDVPGQRFTSEVLYHLNPDMDGCPPWETDRRVEHYPSPDATLSHCWTIRKTWEPQSPLRQNNLLPLDTKQANSAQSERSSMTLSVGSDYSNSSIRSPVLSVGNPKSSRRANKHKDQDYQTSYSGYAAGIEKVVEEVANGEDPYDFDDDANRRDYLGRRIFIRGEDFEAEEDEYEGIARGDSPLEGSFPEMHFGLEQGRSRGPEIPLPERSQHRGAQTLHRPESRPDSREQSRSQQGFRRPESNISDREYAQQAPRRKDNQQFDSDHERRFVRPARKESRQNLENARRDESQNSWKRGESQQGSHNETTSTTDSGYDTSFDYPMRQPIRDFDKYKI